MEHPSPLRVRAEAGDDDAHGDGGVVAHGVVGLGRSPDRAFWVNGRGVHVAWLAEDTVQGPLLVVATFDAESGERSGHGVYDVFPPEVAFYTSSIEDADGSPDGAFAVIISHHDDGVQDGTRQIVVLGHLDDPSGFGLWEAPWGVLEAHLFHVAWDGEAFAVHGHDRCSTAKGEAWQPVDLRAGDATTWTTADDRGRWPRDSACLAVVGLLHYRL